MLVQVAAESSWKPPQEVVAMVGVREYSEERDKVAVEELERRCEFEQQGKPSLVTDHMGDPSSRLRNFSSHLMLVISPTISYLIMHSCIYIMINLYHIFVYTRPPMRANFNFMFRNLYVLIMWPFN